MRPRSNAKWDIYYAKYKKKAFVISLVEWVNKNYFIPVFMDELYKLVRKKEGLTILEPGCGSGLMSSYLAKKNIVTVLDISEIALCVAKDNFNNKNARGEFVLGDLHNMSFRDDSFDVVWNQGVLEHFKDPTAAIKEMIRVTKRGGYIIIFIPAFLSPLHFIYFFLALCGLKNLWPFEEQEFFPAKTFKRFMRQAGCRNTEIKRLWFKSIGFSQVGYCQKID